MDKSRFNFSGSGRNPGLIFLDQSEIGGLFFSGSGQNLGLFFSGLG